MPRYKSPQPPPVKPPSLSIRPSCPAVLTLPIRTVGARVFSPYLHLGSSAPTTEPREKKEKKPNAYPPTIFHAAALPPAHQHRHRSPRARQPAPSRSFPIRIHAACAAGYGRARARSIPVVAILITGAITRSVRTIARATARLRARSLF